MIGWKGFLTGALTGVMACVGCSSEKDTDSQPADRVRTVKTEVGVAGGTVEETITASAVVTSIDKGGRRVQLRGPKGDMAMFTAGPEVKNFDQLREGDTVTATLTRRLVIYVDTQSGDAPSAAYAEALATAPKGKKPGAFAMESGQLVATIKAIDATARTATLQFMDGETEVVPVRPDVDLSRYMVGNNVIIRATATLKVIAKTAS